MELLNKLSSLIWSFPTVALLLGFGIYFAVKLRKSKLLSFPYVFRNTFGSLKKSKGSKSNGLSPLSALATALGGTVGVGSITGVALAIELGGAGSIFWLWVCSAIGMFLKYAEVLLSHKHRKTICGRLIGGPMLCLADAGFKRTAGVFSLLCAAASFGNASVQSNAVSDSLKNLGLRTEIAAVLITACVLFIIIGGREKIADFNSVAVPFFSSGFVLLCLVILILNIKNLPAVLLRIISEAFGFRQAAFGFSASVFINAVRVGTVRGTFSHEAGMGSSAIAHASAQETNSHVQGLWGVSEVFIDSFVVSTLCALCILCSEQSDMGEMFGVFFGGAGQLYFFIAVAVFALAAIISWVYYAESAILHFNKSPVLLKILRCITVASVFAGALLSAESVFKTADLFNGLMIFPNLFILFKLRSEIICAGKA